MKNPFKGKKTKAEERKDSIKKSEVPESSTIVINECGENKSIEHHYSSNALKSPDFVNLIQYSELNDEQKKIYDDFYNMVDSFGEEKPIEEKIEETEPKPEETIN